MSSKKIVIYSINFAPELTGIGKFNGEMVQWLTNHGYKVRVVTAPPYYPQWQVKRGYSASRYVREEMNGAQVWRCPVWVPRHASGIKRLLHLATFALSSIPVIIMQMLWRPQFVLVVEPPLAVAPIAVGLCKLFGVKSWLHVQDFEVDAAFDLGLLPKNKVLKSLVTGIETWLMRRFDTVSSISEQMLNRLLMKKVQPAKVKFFPNWVDTSVIYPLAVKPLGFREQLGIAADDFIVLYAGNMGAKQGLEIMLEAAERLRENRNIHFVLCGDGPVKAMLIHNVGQYELRNVHFLPLQPMEKLNELLNTADVHALVQKQNVSDLVMPSKLTGMLASGKAIIATAAEDTAVYTILDNAKAGLFVPPGDPERFAIALLFMSRYKESCEQYGVNGRTYAVSHLSIESIMRDFEKSFMNTAAPKTNVHNQEIMER